MGAVSAHVDSARETGALRFGAAAPATVSSVRRPALSNPRHRRLRMDEAAGVRDDEALAAREEVARHRRGRLRPVGVDRVAGVVDEHVVAAAHARAVRAAGFGRTGDRFWGFENWGVTPDMVTMAKGIGNGAPLGACTTRAEIATRAERGRRSWRA